MSDDQAEIICLLKLNKHSNYKNQIPLISNLLWNYFKHKQRSIITCNFCAFSALHDKLLSLENISQEVSKIKGEK